MIEWPSTLLLSRPKWAIKCIFTLRSQAHTRTMVGKPRHMVPLLQGRIWVMSYLPPDPMALLPWTLLTVHSGPSDPLLGPWSCQAHTLHLFFFFCLACFLQILLAISPSFRSQNKCSYFIKAFLLFSQFCCVFLCIFSLGHEFLFFY